MSFFNKVLGSIGIGGAKVDTKLEKSEYTAGEMMTGKVEIYGGKVEQQIDSIYITVNTTYIRESNDKKYTDVAPVIKHKINEPLLIGPDETKSIPFHSLSSCPRKHQSPSEKQGCGLVRDWILKMQWTRKIRIL